MSLDCPGGGASLIPKTIVVGRGFSLGANVFSTGRPVHRRVVAGRSRRYTWCVQRPATVKPDLREKGAPVNGQPQTSDRRLFVQLLAFGGCTRTEPLIDALGGAAVDAVLYEDLNDPGGIALLTMSEDPDFFLGTLRPLLHTDPFSPLVSKPEYTMFGRTYSIGYEPDLEDVLIDRPRKRALNPACPWAVWYPLRRRGSFVQLSAEDQRGILMEHGTIGRAFVEADYAYDIRLACHGLDKLDNDFVVGLIGKELHPLSAIVQAMRATRQTSQYMESLGPFFVGKAAWQSKV